MAETPANDRYLPGTLNPEAERTPGDGHNHGPGGMDRTNFFEKFHESMLTGKSLNSHKGVTRYKAMVISEVKTTGGGWFSGKPRYEFKIRIPEIHSAIEDPCAVPPDGGNGANMQKKMAKLVGMHPTAYSASDNESGDELPEPKLGDIVWIEFEKGPSSGRMRGPVYTGRFSKGKGTNNLADSCSALAELMSESGGTVGGNNYAPAGGYPGDPNTWPISDTSEHLEGDSASTLHDVARAYYEELGYTWYTDPFILNLMGVRNTNTKSNNAFDDKIMCMYTDDASTQHVYVWPATTRPGRPSMTDGRATVAILVPSAPQYHVSPPPQRGGRDSSFGQKTYYQGAPSNGKVRGRNSDRGVSYAGDGPDPVGSYRDSDGDDVFTYDPNSIGGCQQCQIHGTSPSMGSGVASRVGGFRADGSSWNWSEGCQVWGAWPDYTFWLSLWTKQIQYGRTYVDYVLIRAEDQPDLWGTQTDSQAADEEAPSAGDPVE